LEAKARRSSSKGFSPGKISEWIGWGIQGPDSGLSRIARIVRRGAKGGFVRRMWPSRWGEYCHLVQIQAWGSFSMAEHNLWRRQRSQKATPPWRREGQRGSAAADTTIDCGTERYGTGHGSIFLGTREWSGCAPGAPRLIITGRTGNPESRRQSHTDGAGQL